MNRTLLDLAGFSLPDAINRLLFVSLTLLALTGAGTAQNPVPLINQPLVPDAIAPASRPLGFTLTVNGTGFVPSSKVYWNGTPRPTTVVSSSQLTAKILVLDFLRPGTASVTVVNPSPGGGTSNAAFFEVTPPSLSVGMNASSFSAPGSPDGVVVGDFNGDGLQDLAVLDNDNGTVDISLGRGDGTFGPAVAYYAAVNPHSLTIADFNHDGKLDLAVVNGGGVNVLLGNGDGTFGQPAMYGANDNPYTIAVGDFNGDGKLDVAVANTEQDYITVLLGNGDGSFGNSAIVHAGLAPYFIAVGDFNGDGKLDLALANSNNGGSSLLLGNGDGTFQPPYSYGPAAVSVAAADFNGDGKLDLVLSQNGPFAILLGNGDGTFQSTEYSEGGFGTPSLGDFNGDGKLDFALVTDDSVVVFLGSGNGTFQPALHFGAGAGPSSPAVGDFNRDGRLELVVADFRALAVSILWQAILSPSSLTFATQPVGTSSPSQPVALNNYSAMPLNITSIKTSGDFSQSNNCGSSLPPGVNCTINVTFTPKKRGTQSESLTVVDSAPGSPHIVGLSGTGTAAKLDPPRLDFGRVEVGGYKSLVTTLTNTDSLSLNISAITISGGAFSQTNNCPASLGGGDLCSIDVTFHPTYRGGYQGAVSISDDGGGSPQQVPLSGEGCTYSHGQWKCVQDLGAPAIRSALARNIVVAVPDIAGPNRVGTRILDVVDSSRDDPFLSNGGKRELMVRFWYPASLTQECKPAEYTSSVTWSYVSELMRMQLPKVRTNSCLDAPMMEGAHPVVVFTHGYTGTFTDYTFLFEDLASRGYVVASVNHTYEATATGFPDGRLVKSVLGSHLGSALQLDDQSLSFALSVRSEDLKFVVSELERLNTASNSPFLGKLDASRIALMGHSLGGEAAVSAVEQNPRFKVGVLIDGALTDASAVGTDKAILILGAGREQWADSECHLWDSLRGPRFAVNLQGAEHLTPSDAVWLATGAIKTGTMGQEKTVAAVRDYIAAFLDANLRGKEADPLLTGPSLDYPDAVVTTQKESLCGAR